MLFWWNFPDTLPYLDARSRRRDRLDDLERRMDQFLATKEQSANNPVIDRVLSGRARVQHEKNWTGAHP